MGELGCFGTEKEAMQHVVNLASELDNVVLIDGDEHLQSNYIIAKSEFGEKYGPEFCLKIELTGDVYE